MLGPIQANSPREIAWTDFDHHLANFLARLGGNTPPEICALISLLSAHIRQGHACLFLPAIPSPAETMRESAFQQDQTISSQTSWPELLAGCPIVGAPGEFRPLIWDGADRLYLYRYWKYEALLAEFIRNCAQVPWHIEGDAAELRPLLDQLFPRESEESLDWQRVAALSSLGRRFSVISGGPGTGKTSTAVKILRLLTRLNRESSISIALAAPTGKAAGRFKEAISQAKTRLQLSEEDSSKIPAEAHTLHRLLGMMPGSIRPHHHETNPLPFDAVIVDEASMIDLSLMARLVQALSPSSRLILLGDKDQLASVEPGAVLGNISGGVSPNGYSAVFRKLIREISGDVLPTSSENPISKPLNDSIVVLEKSYRFDPGSGIYALGRAVNAGEGDQALELAVSGKFQDVGWRDLPPASQLERELGPILLAHYERCLQTNTLEDTFLEFNRFRLLCPLRQGPFGVDQLNTLVENLLQPSRKNAQAGGWYKGRPVMIRQNDYYLRLFNGDIGFCFAAQSTQSDSRSNLQVFFPRGNGTFRGISPVRLPPFEPAFAATVHKSQGSEFDEVLLLLPDGSSPILVRELIYTAITRAQKKVTIWGDRDIFRNAVRQKMERQSGLFSALWK
jgi:exodeoxyribonuclease V alpha subunit